MAVLIGNIELSDNQLSSLRTGIINVYSEKTGTPKEALLKQFNSNINNYKSLFDDINLKGDLDSIKIRSSKPLVSLFYFSSTSYSHTTEFGKKFKFRKKFIDVLYKYAFGKTKDEYDIQFDGTGNSLIKKIEGYWICHYSKDNRFIDNFHSSTGAPLYIVAMTIIDQGINKGFVQFYQPDNAGSGTVEIEGSNLVFHLRGYRNNEPICLLMNCGRHVKEMPHHVRRAAGIGLYINASGNPKSVRCLMEYSDIPNKIDITTDAYKTSFSEVVNLLPTDKADNKLSKIISFFYQPHNTAEVGITNFTSAD